MSDAQLIADWLARNGGARRFRSRDSANAMGLRFYLEDRGYETRFTGVRGGHKCLVKRHGSKKAPMRLDMRGLIALVDQHRRAEGLEPFARGSGK